MSAHVSSGVFESNHQISMFLWGLMALSWLSIWTVPLYAKIASQPLLGAYFELHCGTALWEGLFACNLYDYVRMMGGEEQVEQGMD